MTETEVPFKATRKVREHTRYSYQKLVDEYARQTRSTAPDPFAEDEAPDGPIVVSDKEMAVVCGVSERQVRKARAEDMNAYMADHMVTRALGIHPMLLYGADEWLVPEANYAVDIFDKKIDPENLGLGVDG